MTTTPLSDPTAQALQECRVDLLLAALGSWVALTRLSGGSHAAAARALVDDVDAVIARCEQLITTVGGDVVMG